MSSSFNHQRLVEDTNSDSSDNDEGFLDNSYTSQPGTSKRMERTESSMNLVAPAFNPPPDRLGFNFIVFYLLGITSILPWNFFLTADEYWLFKFRNVTDNSTTDLTPLQRRFISDFTVAGSIPGMAFLIINALLSHRIPLKLRMIGSMIIVTAFFIVTTSFVEVNTDNWQHEFYVITIVIVVFINSAAATLTGASMGLAGLFPSEYITAIVSGQALSGIFSAFSDIIALTFHAEPKVTAMVYFSIGVFTLVITLLCYIVMSRTAFFKFYVHTKLNTIGSSSSLQAEEDNLRPNFVEVLRKIYMHAFCLWFVFVVTLCIYPAVTDLVQSEYHGTDSLWANLYFTPVANYLLFNSGDYLGRILAGFFEMPKNSPHLIILLTCVRAGFLPALMMGHSSLHRFLPVVVHSDVVFMLIMAVFALTNGYITNITLIMAPRVVMKHEKELASSIMAACLGMGIACGSLLSMAMVQLF